MKLIISKESVTLQTNQSNYHIETPFQLSQRYTISFNASSKSTIRLINWFYNSIDIEITSSTVDDNVQLDENNNNSLAKVEIAIEKAICIVTSDYDALKIDNKKEGESSLNLIGSTLTENNFSKGKQIKRFFFLKKKKVIIIYY